MIEFTHGNLLEADCEALVNTVNTKGVMGKGIALMFKDRFPGVFREYARACKAGEVRTGSMHVVPTGALQGARVVIDFPTKEHWKAPSRLEWIESGLKDLRRVIAAEGIRSVALPPLGCGNGGLDWRVVRPMVERELASLEGVRVLVFEPVAAYQNQPKPEGKEGLTPARALIAELIRRYEILCFECSLLEIHKLAWVMERELERLGLANPLKLKFQPDRYGPYAPNLNHLLNGLDGSYLTAEKRIPDAKPSDPIGFQWARKEELTEYLHQQAADFLPALESADRLIDTFQTPLGMEVLATVDWLVRRQGCAADMAGIRAGLQAWPAGAEAGRRKSRLFEDRLIELALERLAEHPFPIREVAA